MAQYDARIVLRLGQPRAQATYRDDPMTTQPTVKPRPYEGLDTGEIVGEVAAVAPDAVVVADFASHDLRALLDRFAENGLRATLSISSKAKL